MLAGFLMLVITKLFVLAFFIACPIAYWGFGKWLNDFAYRIEIQWWMFALAGMMAIVVAIFTVSTQAIRAAVANPVDSLRDE
jgi:putative ABC transport system permease protein